MTSDAGSSPVATPGPVASHSPGRRFGDERGASIITFMLLLPVLIMLIELIVIGGRLAVTQADVNSAARQGARQASVGAGPFSAREEAERAVEVALADKGFRCQSPDVRLGPTTFFFRGGQVEVVVSCTVALSDISFLSPPGTVTVTARAIEPIDEYRVIGIGL